MCCNLDFSLNDTEQVLVHSPVTQVPQQQALRGPSNARTFTAVGIKPCHVAVFSVTTCGAYGLVINDTRPLAGMFSLIKCTEGKTKFSISGGILK